jgi:hypothetical protein
VFVSYAREDERLRDKLSDHLGGLRTGGYISESNDGQIVPGQEWTPEIIRRLDEADIILLLVTSSFLGSEYIGRVELGRALERHRRGEAIVIPVILKPADWQSTGLEGLQALPKDGKAVSTWSDQDAAFLNIAQGCVVRSTTGVPAKDEPISYWRVVAGGAGADRVAGALVPLPAAVMPGGYVRRAGRRFNVSLPAPACGGSAASDELSRSGGGW